MPSAVNLVTLGLGVIVGHRARCGWSSRASCVVAVDWSNRASCVAADVAADANVRASRRRRASGGLPREAPASRAHHKVVIFASSGVVRGWCSNPSREVHGIRTTHLSLLTAESAGLVLSRELNRSNQLKHTKFYSRSPSPHREEADAARHDVLEHERVAPTPLELGVLVVERACARAAFARADDAHERRLDRRVDGEGQVAADVARGESRGTRAPTSADW